MIEEDNENLYYDDNVMKYMARPHFSEFNNLTYPQYFEKYSITPSSPASTSRQIYHDKLSNYVIIYSKEIVIRYQFLKSKPYFYQQLLLKITAKNEFDYRIILNGFYREKFLSL